MKKNLLFLVFGTVLLNSGIIRAQCNPPAEFSVNANSVTQTSATFNWPVVADAVSYQIILVPRLQLNGDFSFSNPLPDNALILNTGNVSTYTVNDLSPGTLYLACIKTVCDGDLISTYRNLTTVSIVTLASNDSCSTAISVTPIVGNVISSANMTVANTLGATADSSVPTTSPTTCGSQYNDVWFKFVATETSHGLISTKINENYNISFTTLGVSLYSGSCDNLTLISCQTGIGVSFSNLTVGTEYYIRLYNFTNVNSFEPMRIQFAVVSKPINDVCDNAIVVPVVPANNNAEIAATPGNTLGATETLGTCNSTVSRDVWYTFTATQTSLNILIQNFNTNVSNKRYDIYAGQCGVLVPVSCGITITAQSLTNNLVVGQQYFIRVYQLAQSQVVMDDFEISIFEKPDNDEHLNPRPITVYNDFEPVSAFQYLNGSTMTSVPSACATAFNTGDVWYSFVAPSKYVGLYMDNSVTSATSYSIAVYATDGTNLTEIICDGFKPIVAVTIGNTYLVKIRVADESNNSPRLRPLRLFIKSIPDVIELTPTNNLSQLVEDVLINNSCVTVGNITGSGGSIANTIEGIGTFTNTYSNFPIANGIVLATGVISDMEGFNTSTVSTGNGAWGSNDPDLEAIVLSATQQTMNSRDVTKLEFDFNAPYESINFNFLFASEEYGVFQCSFSDAFAFLLTDTVTNQTVNLAVVPGSTIPISVVTIRDMAYYNACLSVNEQYFRSYDEQSNSSDSVIHNVNFNGMTELLTASSPIVPGRTYHVKLVIADRVDTQYDSAVFIQAGSFLQGPPSCVDKIQLTAFYDLNNDGQQQENEPLFSNGQFLYTVNDETEPVIIQSPIGRHNLFDETAGTNTFNVSYQINPEYLPYYSLATNQYNNLSIPSGSGTQTIKFPISMIQTFADVSVSVIPLQAPRAGNIGRLKVQIKNNGNATASGILSFEKPSIATLTTVTPAAQLNATGFTFNYSNLLPNETNSFLVTYSIPPIPQVNIDDVLTSSAQVTNSNDAFINDNAAALEQIVVAAYDPNDKQEKHGGSIEFVNFSENDYLEYTIRFQNTGTANAINVRIEDMLGPQYNLESLRMISASHTYYMQRIDNEVKWFFDFIQLPGAVQSPLESIGYLTFKIKLNPGFTINDVITNTAAIYFDTNPPIITNTHTTVFFENLSVDQPLAQQLLIYPNPAKAQVFFNLPSETIQSIELYDVTGKCIVKKSVNGRQFELNTSNLARGFYVVKVRSASGIEITRKLAIN